MTHFSTLTIPPLFGVLYRVDRTRDAASVSKEVRDEIGGDGSGITIMDSTVSASVAWREAATLSVPVHTITKYPMAKLQLMAIIAELGLMEAKPCP
jgi:hypothetical protein